MKIRIKKTDLITAIIAIAVVALVFATIGNTRYYKMYLGQLYGLNWWPRILIATIILTIIIPRIIKKYNEGTALFATIGLSIISPIIVAISIMIEAESGVWKFFDSHYFSNAPFMFIATLFFGIIVVPMLYFYLSCFVNRSK